MFFNNEFVHQAFLYTGNDLLQYTFRVELRMKDDVDQDALRYAVDCTMQRCPYLAVKTEENGAEIDIVPNESPVMICEGKNTPCLCTEAVNRHFIAVAFEGKRIFLDVHHGLTDGTGMERVAKTLVYYYLTRKYAITIDDTGINTLETPISPGEYKDPFSNAKDLPEKPLSTYAAEPAFHLGSFNNITEKKQIYYFKIKESDVMELVKSNDGTPNAFFSAILYKAISKHHPDASEPIVGGVAISTRKALNIDESNACLIGIAHIKYNNRFKDASLERLGTLGRGSVILQSDDQNVLASIPGKRQLTQYFKTIPDHNQRRMIFLGLIQKTTSLDTYSISYIGKRIGIASEITSTPITPSLNLEKAALFWKSTRITAGLMSVLPRISKPPNISIPSSNILKNTTSNIPSREGMKSCFPSRKYSDFRPQEWMVIDSII